MINALNNQHSIDLQLALQALDSANDGISIVDISDSKQPLIYVNKAFELLTGYSQKEIYGKNCRFLQGDIVCETERAAIRYAITNSMPCRVILQNVTKQGKKFWNELSLSPILCKSGKTKYYVGIQKNITKEVEQREKIEFMAEHDGLTSLLNERGFYKYAGQMLERAIQEKLNFAIGVVDIDNFKKVNDEFGHLFGNNILQAISDEFSRRFHSMDVIARMGGDEFIFASIVKNQDRNWFFEKIQDCETGVVQVFNGSVKLSLSAGLCIVQAERGVLLEHLLRTADDEMYQHKKSRL